MISFITQPNKYTPVNNPIIFQVASDNSAIQYFAIQLTDNQSNIIANLKIYTTPANRSGAYADLSNILSNTVNYQLLPTTNIIDLTPNTFQPYQLTITEKLYSGGTIVNGTTTVTGLFYAYNALIDKVTFSGYDYKNYVLNLTGNTTNFLTNKPALSTLYRTSTEYLSFLNDGTTGNVRFKFYGAGNLLLGNHTVPYSGTSCSRIDLSPATINTYFGSTLSNDYGLEFSKVFGGAFGSIYGVNNANYFTVALEDTSGNTKSLTRTYVLKNVDCSYKPVNILFGNQLSGYDSITLFNPRETIDVTKTSINRNPFQVNAAGVYTNISNNVYNNEVDVINVNSTSTYSVFSDVLRDEDSLWLKELLKSESVYIGLNNGQFYPINIATLNYPVQQKKYNNTSLTRAQLTFTINDTGIII